MIGLTPIFLAILYALVFYRFSAWRLAQQLNQRSSVLVDPSLAPSLEKLARALDLEKVTVHIYEVDPINGLAAPDGRIFITRGFYNKFRNGTISAEELASVIAHELGHVALGHSRRRMIDFSSQNAMRVAVGAILSRIVPGVGMWIANILANLLMAGLSRGDEFEADEYATALMIKSGMGAQSQISMFEKLNKIQGNKNQLPAWLLSHPKTAERIAAINANIKRYS